MMDLFAEISRTQDMEFNIDSDPFEPSWGDAKKIAVEEFSYERFEKLRIHYRIERPMSLHELLAADFHDDYIIEDCLVANQAGVTAGASKTLKTTAEVNRALALISGRNFLGRFRVNRTCSVFFATAESGKATVQRTFQGIAEQMGIDLHSDELKPLTLNWWVPKANNLELMDYFCFEAEKSGAEVCIIDPLYQVLDDAQSSYILNGQQLATVCNRILAMGATPILVDHAKRSSANAKEFAPLELDDISGAGKAEYFRQWTLVSRRSRFTAEPGEPHKHDLWLTIGGSAGHASTWALDITEQIHKDRSREYMIETLPRSDVLQARQVARRDTTKVKAEQKAEALEARMRRKASELIETVYKGDCRLALTQSDIEGRLAVTGGEIKRVLGIVLGDGQLRLVAKSVTKNSRKFDGYMLNSALPIEEWKS